MTIYPFQLKAILGKKYDRVPISGGTMDTMDLIREGKIQRYFRATRKLNVPTLVSHITQRAAGKEPLFLEDGDYLTMLWLMKEIAENYSLQMFAFCLMPNHAHLLFSPKEANLYDAMRDLFSRYAMRFNRKYERKGHLFGAPYRQAVCLDDSYLLAASLYIHQNPVKAGLATDPLNYRWSSCRLYCDGSAPKSFVDPDFILELLPKGEVSIKERYRHLLKQGGELEIGQVLEQEDAIERFRSKLTSMFPSLFKRLARKKQIARFSGIGETRGRSLLLNFLVAARAQRAEGRGQMTDGRAQMIDDR